MLPTAMPYTTPWKVASAPRRHQCAGLRRRNMGLWFYAEMERAMKTTVEVSDDLYRRAKAEAALRGRKLKDLVEEGLRLVLETPRESGRRRSLAALMKGARGAVDSAIPDLASNPKHLTGFGHDARRHR